MAGHACYQTPAVVDKPREPNKPQLIFNNATDTTIIAITATVCEDSTGSTRTDSGSIELPFGTDVVFTKAGCPKVFDSKLCPVNEQREAEELERG